MAIVNRSAPAAAVVPIVIYDNVAAAVDWLCAAFGFTERLRVPGGDGAIFHAQLSVGDGAIMLGRRGGPFTSPDSGINQYVHVTVDDVDAHCARATSAGARVLHPPHDMPFGERQYTAQDLEGHWWTFSQHIADVAPETWGAVTK